MAHHVGRITQMLVINGAVTRREHGGSAARHGVLPLLREIRDLPDKDAVVCGSRHLPHFPLHLHDGQVPQTHRPLQLTDLHRRNTSTRHVSDQSHVSAAEACRADS